MERDAIIYERQRFGSNASFDGSLTLYSFTTSGLTLKQLLIDSDLLWLTENDADQSSEGEVAPKLRRRYANSSANSTNNSETRATIEAQPINIE